MTQQRSEAPRLRAMLAQGGKGLGLAPTSMIFRVLTGGQNAKNLQVSRHLPCLPFCAGYLFLQNAPENLLLIYQVLIDKQVYCCYNNYISIRYIIKRYGDAYVRIYNFRDAYAKRNEWI